MSKLLKVSESEKQQILEMHGFKKPKVNEQSQLGLKDYIEKGIDMLKSNLGKGINMVKGTTGNKFWDAVKAAGIGKMQDGKSPNEKQFCLDDSCENSITVFSDGTVIFEQSEFDKKVKGKMEFNNDGSFVFKWSDGGVSKKHMPK